MSDRELIRMDNDLCRAEERITTLLAVIEQCESVINQANEALPSPEFIKALRAIKKVKEQ